MGSGDVYVVDRGTRARRRTVVRVPAAVARSVTWRSQLASNPWESLADLVGWLDEHGAVAVAARSRQVAWNDHESTECAAVRPRCASWSAQQQPPTGPLRRIVRARPVPALLTTTTTLPPSKRPPGSARSACRPHRRRPRGLRVRRSRSRSRPKPCRWPCRAATSAAVPRPDRARRSRSACRCWPASPTRPSPASRSGSCWCRPASSRCRWPRCSRRSPTHAGMTVAPVYGGASRHTQIEDLQKGVELVVATPLRLIDLIKSNEIDARRTCRSCASTRPTAWPTTASRRRSSGSCGTAPAAARPCCSRRRSTATSAT